MLGRIRASTSSLDTLEASPSVGRSKILKDDSFSIYEATLMKLKLGAQRDSCEVINDCSPCAEEANLKANLNPASTSCSMMDTESDNWEQRRKTKTNVSILHFFKVMDPEHACVSSGGSTGQTISSTTSVESHYRSEVEGVRVLEDCEMSD
ncbi:hypothetical protein VNO78_24001 [Psophocarpus tetragonolobus]|uniref:Uncharacterized protein n=1 Tax=Psophocarpus tetragonolobus TaxID=3891 RepID=A0AAN9S513_PSOTE